MFMRIRKSLLYSRTRQYFPMRSSSITDDRGKIENGQSILIDWPMVLKKPRVGIVQDPGIYPSWTKYAQFLDNNSFPYEIYHIHNQDWREKARDFDVIMGIPSNASYDLEEVRGKYFLLETYLEKTCYPSMEHAFLFEDKKLEAFLSNLYGIPYVNTYVSSDKQDALHLIENFTYPVVSKVVPCSGSVGVELVRTKGHARRIVEQAFSNNGRKIHIVYARQKNFVYFQDYIPNDGYDIRVVVVGNRVFGFYRLVPKGDFRASGFHFEEWGDLPEKAMKIARYAYKVIKSPQLVVDMIPGLDGNFYINEFSPTVQMSTLHQLRVNGIAGAYVFDNDDSFYFEPGKYWVHELALKEFFLNYYLPKLSIGS